MQRHLARLQALADTTQLNTGNVRSSKIICTIGPKVANRQDLNMLMAAGMNVARFNFSHGEYDWFASSFDLVRQVAKDRGRSDVAIALDTKGPEIRTGRFAKGSPAGDPSFALQIQRGDVLVFATDPALQESGDAANIFVDYADIGSTLQPGDAVLVDDGLIEFVVRESGDGWVRAEAMNGGSLGERKGINLPGKSLSLPAVSVKDRSDLEFGVQQQVDLVFASFVRRAEHVQQLRDVLGRAGAGIQIISKIENLEGVQNFEGILAESDGIMVARGDLGIEIPAPKVVVSQKLMITRCNLVGKPVICATQMLESMVVQPRPTRAEVSDVANAVMDGADAVMLSGETAKGKYPEEAVKAMSYICAEAEAAIDPETMERRQQLVMPKNASAAEAVSAAAARTAQDAQASLVIVVTETGEAPRLVAKYRPSVPIVAVCLDEAVARRCCLLRGVIPVHVPLDEATQKLAMHNPTQIVNSVLSKALEQIQDLKIGKGGKIIARGDKAVVLHDADITDNSELCDWAMRIVDV